MKTLLNYIGQVRLYSLADLVLLLVAIGSSHYELAGALLLHLGFLAYLEKGHAHSYRAKVPGWVAYILLLVGLILFGKIEGVLYVLCSYLYTQKTKTTGIASPIFRGLQSFFIVAGIVGYVAPLSYVVAWVMFLRNLLGDFRDTEKDKKEGMKTIPVILNVSKSVPYVHLVGMIISSAIWWSFSSISIVWLCLVIVIELATYNLTPR